MGYLLQGRLIFAVIWIAIIILSLWTKTLARKRIALTEANQLIFLVIKIMKKNLKGVCLSCKLGNRKVPFFWPQLWK